MGELLFRITLIISATVLITIGCGSGEKKEEAAINVETTETQIVISDSTASPEVATLSKATLKPEPVPVRKGNFTVQIGSFRSEPRAHEAIIKYKKMGYDAYIEETKVGRSDRIWFRVRIGRYQRSSEAKRIADELIAKGNVKAWVDKVPR